ncbi:T9SS type A sorting domain-containing protein, partial [Candidatus Poribacteria bacterium]|nr:T9SS type A sorting domain-containing protein [Candidatus Poribacteria bacterium]
VTADNGGPWQFDLSMPIIVPVIAETALFANFPNPFNPETWIPFDLSQAADVTVRIYDIAGRPIRRLDLGWQQPGSYRRRATAAYWDGRNEVGEAASSGVYLYALRAGGHREMRRMIVRK